jgi:hypothetical protein
VLADGSVALDRVEAASIRFPKLKEVKVNLSGALSDDKGFTDVLRAPILAKLCTFTFVTKLFLYDNDITVVPDAIGALTKLKQLDLHKNKIATLPASLGRLTALETLDLRSNNLTAVPASIGSLTALTTLSLDCNRITKLPDTIGGMTALTTLSQRKRRPRRHDKRDAQLCAQRTRVPGRRVRCDARSAGFEGREREALGRSAECVRVDHRHPSRVQVSAICLFCFGHLLCSLLISFVLPFRALGAECVQLHCRGRRGEGPGGGDAGGR